MRRSSGVNSTVRILKSEAVCADVLEQRIIRQDAMAAVAPESKSAFVCGHYLEVVARNAVTTSDGISHKGRV